MRLRIKTQQDMEELAQKSLINFSQLSLKRNPMCIIK
jgi:hypothetical protein